MNSKKKRFFNLYFCSFTFSIIIVLYVNYFFYLFIWTKSGKLCIHCYTFTSFGINHFPKFFLISILKPLFKSDEKLEQSIKETIHELNIPVSNHKMNTQLLEKYNR